MCLSVLFVPASRPTRIVAGPSPFGRLVLGFIAYDHLRPVRVNHLYIHKGEIKKESLFAVCFRTTEAFLGVSQEEQQLFLHNETAFHSMYRHLR